MCGIMGYYRFGKIKPDKDKIAKMFSLLETRGKDSSGYAYIKDGRLSVSKEAVPSSELIKSTGWQTLNLPPVMIFHTRLKTKGSETNSMNNHPLFTKKGMCIVHNGQIFNDEELFRKYNTRDAEVDSEAILSLFSHKKSTTKTLFDEVIGSYAVALIDKKNPSLLKLVRKDNPLDLYFNNKDDILYFCSERNIMQIALGIEPRSYRRFNLGEEPYHYYQMDNNHELILDEKGISSYTKYTPRQQYYDFFYEDLTYNRYGYYHNEIEVECPWCLGLTAFTEGYLINRCMHCGMEIKEEDVFYL